MVSRCEEAYSVRMMCRLLKVSPSGYYDWCDRPMSRRDRDNAELLEQIHSIHAESDGVLRQPEGVGGTGAPRCTLQREPCGPAHEDSEPAGHSRPCGAGGRMPAARRLRDRRCKDHLGLPAAGPARDPRSRARLARRRLQLNFWPPPTGARWRSPRPGSLETIAFPAISTGAYGYPVKPAARVAVATAREFAFESTKRLREVIFCWLLGGGPRGVRGTCCAHDRRRFPADAGCAARAAALA